ncbi:MAG: response regulator receiver protein [Bryobacterales bacterium]|nr:response regulator receiver protein [Bryobacterales bacterium]
MRTQTILVIDDEASDREMMAEILQREGYTVLEANAYEDALMVFHRNREVVDLIVSDISLPGGNGCELAIAMRKQKSDVRMLFVSGHVGAEVCRFYGLELSDLHFLRKPFSATDLLSRVRRILNCTEAFPELKDEQAKPQVNARP